MPVIADLEAQLKQAQDDESNWQTRLEKATADLATAEAAVRTAKAAEFQAQKGYDSCRTRVAALKSEIEALGGE